MSEREGRFTPESEIQHEMADSYVMGVVDTGNSDFHTVVDGAARIGIPRVIIAGAMFRLANLGFIESIAMSSNITRKVNPPQEIELIREE